MGDQIGVAVSGTLYYVPLKEFVRILNLPVSVVGKTALFSALCRINTLYMIARAGSGHVGSSFSSIDIMSWLQLNEVCRPDAGDANAPCDIFFSSKGHDAPALYSTLIGLGKLDFKLLHQLRRLNGLPGHPDISTPNTVTNTGSLGMGISKAKGMIFAHRLQRRSGNVYVLTGDGELQEGQFWESLIAAANQRLHEITVIIDHNKLQSDTLVSKVNDLGDLEAKLAAFGWHVSRCDGNDMAALSATLSATKDVTDTPKVIIADTIKGKGVSFMEHTSIDSDVEYYKFHSGAPTEDVYIKAAQELIDKANIQLESVGAVALELETVRRPVVVQPENPQRLIQAYSDALIEHAHKNQKIVALDADLILDTGLIPFQKEFPDRFFECGIAEQDMVSQAGTMALSGLLPVVHSFACFLTSRAFEQIYNNCTERTKIIYVGSLAGVLPGGPGHSHQAVRDVTAMSGMPGMRIVEPVCAAQVKPALQWAARVYGGSTYLRLTSIPLEGRLELAEVNQLIEGRGHLLRQGKDLTLVAAGAIMTIQALKTAKQLAAQGLEAQVVCTPWLNCIDLTWFAGLLTGVQPLVTLENHGVENGFGCFLVSQLAMAGLLGQRKVLIEGIRGIPVCGRNDEVLVQHGLDECGLTKAIMQAVRG